MAALGGEHLIPIQPHNLANILHRKRLNRSPELGHHQNVQSLGGQTAGDRRQIDNRNNLAPDIGHPHQMLVGICQLGDGRHHQHLTDLENVDAKQLALAAARCFTQVEQQQLKFVVAGKPGSFFNFLLRGSHGKSLWLLH